MRARNVVSVLMHCFAICCVVSIGWMVIGYSIAFGPDAGWFGGFDAALLLSLPRAPDDGSTTELLTVVFQMTFAIITPALIVGGVVVHETAGIAALVLAILVGRRPRFPEHVQPPHSPVLVMIGASMLWVG